MNAMSHIGAALVKFINVVLSPYSDCMGPNIMMDPKPTYPNGFHPIVTLRNRNYKGAAKHYTRTARPTKYYLIDFGLSIKFSSTHENPVAIPIFGGDRTVPEFQTNPCGLYNPFRTDVYYIGNMIREDFLQVQYCYLVLTPHYSLDYTRKPKVWSS